MHGSVQAALKFKVTRLAGNGYISLGNVHGFARTNAWSVGGWFKTSTTGGVLICKQSTSGSFPGWGLFVPSGLWRIGFGSTIGQAAGIQYSGPALNDGRWHRIDGSYDGSSNANNMRLYLDGALATTTIISNNLASSISNSAPLTIGARNGGADSHFTGDLSDVCVFDGVISLADHQALHASRCPPDALSLSLSRPLLTYMTMGLHAGDPSLASAGAYEDVGSSGFDGTATNASLVTRV